MVHDDEDSRVQDGGVQAVWSLVMCSALLSSGTGVFEMRLLMKKNPLVVSYDFPLPRYEP